MPYREPAGQANTPLNLCLIELFLKLKINVTTSEVVRNS